MSVRAAGARLLGRSFGFACLFTARAGVADPEPLPAVATPVDATAAADPGETTAPRAGKRVQLQEIAVGAKRGKAAATEQHVDQEQIDRADAKSAGDLVRLIPGAHLPTNSRGEALIHLRDAGERQVAVFLDGAQLMVPWDYAIDLSLVPATMLGGMSIVKGASSVLWGANVLGGAVNLETRRLDEQGTLTEVVAQGGLPKSGLGALTHLGDNGRWNWTASASLDGHSDYPLPHDAVLPFSQIGTDTRTNTDARHLQAMGRIERKFGGQARASLTLLHLDAEKGAAAESHKDPAKASVRFWRYPDWQNTMAIAAVSVPYGQGSDVRATVWGGRFAQTIASYRDTTYTEPLVARQEDHDLTVGSRLVVGRLLGPGTLRLTAQALQSTHEQVDTTIAKDGKETSGATQEYAQVVYSGGGEYEWRPSEALTVRAGGGLDGVNMSQIGAFPGDKPSFQAWSGLAGVAFALTEQWTVRTSIGRKTRFPTQRELYGAALNKFLANPDLNPEASKLGEAGVGYTTRRLSAEVTGFATDTADTIDQRDVVDPIDSKKKKQRYNRTGSQVMGVEAVVTLRPWRSSFVQAHGTAMSVHAFDDKTKAYDAHLERRPDSLATLTLGWAPPLGLSGLAQATWTGSSYSLDENSVQQKIDGTLRLDLRAAYRLNLGPLGTEVFARVDNVTDSLYLPTLGLPEPGRQFQAGVKAVF